VLDEPGKLQYLQAEKKQAAKKAAKLRKKLRKPNGSGNC
jgi:hypothetical protein